jgi:ANTAR domain-containing protein
MSGTGSQEEDPRDLRIRQLQYALDSRVLIEQSKGILSERFGLTIDTSFEVLRNAARANGVKLNALAAELVEARGTPPPIAEALVRAGYRSKEGFEERAADAEQAFADLNDALTEIHSTSNWTRFVCECSNPLCSDSIELTAAVLASVHENRGHYVVKPGHEVPDVEQTVAVIDDLLVVRKNVPGEYS